MDAPKRPQLFLADTVGALEVVEGDLALVENLLFALQRLGGPFVLDRFEEGVDLFLAEYVCHLAILCCPGFS